jgi:hypothetical protein
MKDAMVVRSGSSIVGLRHDLDTVYGLRWGLPKIIAIEKKYDVKSTFFVRVDVIRSDKDKRVLKRIADEGWEIGLHLINTINDTALLSPEGELKLLKKLLDVPIYGVTPCGSTIGFKGDVTWRIMCSLGLKYMEGYGMPDFKVNTFVFPTHLSLDIHYVRNFGEKEGYQKFKEDLLQRLESHGLATILVHPEGFVRSVRGDRVMKIPLTLLRRGMMNKVYNKFLCEFRDKVEFKNYIDIISV